MAQNQEKISPATSIAAGIAIKLIHLYRYLVSPWTGHQCRFYPTCSHYAEEALARYGFIKGSYLSCRRLLKCHPWHAGGIDNVPEPPKDTHRKPNKKWLY